MYADSMTNINRIEAPSYQDMPANSQTRQLVTRNPPTRKPVNPSTRKPANPPTRYTIKHVKNIPTIE